MPYHLAHIVVGPAAGTATAGAAGAPPGPRLRLFRLSPRDAAALRAAAARCGLPPPEEEADRLHPGALQAALAGTSASWRGVAVALAAAAPALGEQVAAALAADATREWAWQIRDRILRPGRRTLVMGVVNVTPDSFSDGGRFAAPAAAVEHGLRLAAEGADLIDVGGESTRPGAAPVPAVDERERVVPVVRALARQTDVPVSVDTSRAATAAAALEAGARVVNDVSALSRDSDLGAVVAGAGAGIVLMHMRGSPATMQDAPVYHDVVAEVLERLREALDAAATAGVAAEQTVVDPGIGFGKRLGHNLTLLRHTGALRALGRPVLVGASRKSMLGELTGRPVDDRLPGSLAAAAAAVQAGASILRVHDVAATRDLVRVLDAVRSAETT